MKGLLANVRCKITIIRLKVIRAFVRTYFLTVRFYEWLSDLIDRCPAIRFTWNRQPYLYALFICNRNGVITSLYRNWVLSGKSEWTLIRDRFVGKYTFLIINRGDDGDGQSY